MPVSAMACSLRTCIDHHERWFDWVSHYVDAAILKCRRTSTGRRCLINEGQRAFSKQPNRFFGQLSGASSVFSSVDQSPQGKRVGQMLTLSFDAD